jgi:allantoinase
MLREFTMVKTHGRYRYSSIGARPDYTWPGGKRLAVYIALNIEQFSYGEGKGAAIAPPDQATSDSIYSWRDYGNRVGIWRLLELLDEINLPAEAQINTAIYEHCPDIPEALRKRKVEILGHGISNSFEQGEWPEAQEAAHIREVTDFLTAREGQAPAGWMSPWLSNSGLTPDLLQEAGYRYFMDWTCDDQPIWMTTRNGRILAMPYPIEANDTRGIVWYRYTSSEFADMIIEGFDEMLRQSKKQPLVCPISLHPFVVGRPYRLGPLRRAFEHIAAHRDEVWITQPGQICAHIETLGEQAGG